MKKEADHALEFLLAFDGRVHHYPDGYLPRFEIKRVPASGERPHGLRYSFTLHGPDGKRLIGFDNAHIVPVPGSKFKERPEAADHRHRTEDDAGRPYEFESAEKLLDDFSAEVERVLKERGIPLNVTKTEDRSGS
ncbi:MAG: hypothetical protein HY834_19105 [Devosia nanyangense]|uniref:Uncharacterized protein n=1 Tax=Devosia nanyangense TaxID=1228055 RepID=A0A933L440_9HYPH|nr:hypothetical protein [Devosia nanyangense]